MQYTFMNKPITRKKRHIESYFSYKNKKFPYFFKQNLSKNFNITHLNCPLRSEMGLKYTGPTRYIYSQPLKSCIRIIKYYFRVNKLAKYNFKILVTPNIVLTSKPKEVRMGKGKGPISTEKVGILRSGQFVLKILSVKNSDLLIIHRILKICSSKLPFAIKVVSPHW